jgi:hypothetical protein
MAQDVKNVYAAAPLIAGSLRVAPLGTTAPSGVNAATDPIDDAFVDLGYIGADGFTERLERRIERKRAFGGRVVKVLQTEFTATLQLVLLESLRADTLKAVYGSQNVTVTPADAEHGTRIEVRKNGIKLPHLSWIMDTQDEELTAFYRSYLPDGQIVETGEVKVVHTDTIEYNVTIEAFPDESGENIYTWSDDGQTTGS